MSTLSESHGLLSVLVVAAIVVCCQAFYTGQFEQQDWTFQVDKKLAADTRISFIVALELHNVNDMHNHLMDVSDPSSVRYGRYLSLQEIHEKYGPTEEERQKVVDFFHQMEGVELQTDFVGDLFQVTAPVQSISNHLQTELAWVTHKRRLTDKKSVRCITPLSGLPEELHSLVSFISLNMPVNHAMPRAAKALAKRRRELKSDTDIELSEAVGGRAAAAGLDDHYSNAEVDATTGGLGVRPGNKEIQVFFQPVCGASSTTLNSESPPCQSAAADDVPTFYFSIFKHANSRANPYLLSNQAQIISMSTQDVYCYNTYTANTCSGNDGSNCTCIAKLTGLDMYTQLKVNMTSVYNGQTLETAPPSQSLGVSDYIALTDTATATFLSELYSIPKGISVQYGSNQSVAEFYGEFYSNKDLEQFFMLSGLPNATIPDSNVYGDLANDQSSPGGEAQLDVEYIMALAPNANTYFYSFSDLNPYDPINEGFLAYLTYVSNQESPPLVHSLSYGDQESNIFNASNNGSIIYGNRCDQEFMKMGLRGLTVVFSSGDDGIGGNLIRDNPDAACAAANPSWPAASPYVTAVGATMMTDQYTKLCEQSYAVSSSYPNLPLSNQLNVQCSGTGETVCTSTFGGVITSGGGFSNVSNRTLAGWQTEAVETYLRDSNAAAYPPLDYFNAYGRGYPDVSTYGSNYFVYLRGQVTRESGTSASAPVFAAMVTLWNDMRLAYKLPPMGFIAPFLYQAHKSTPDAFQDVTTGDNACGVGYSLEGANCCQYAFAASPGWDAVTGLGTPNFEILASLVLNNQSSFPNIGPYPDAGANSANAYSSSSNDGDNSDDEIDNVKAFPWLVLLTIIAVVALILAVAGVVLLLKLGRGGDSSHSTAPAFEVTSPIQS